MHFISKRSIFYKFFAIVYTSNDSIIQNIINSTLLINLFKKDDIVYTIDRWRKLLLILHCYSIIVSNLDFFCFFSAHPCTVISYCNVMFNGIKHIIPHIASILELISSENQCTFSFANLIECYIMTTCT